MNSKIVIVYTLASTFAQLSAAITIKLTSFENETNYICSLGIGDKTPKDELLTPKNHLPILCYTTLANVPSSNCLTAFKNVPMRYQFTETLIQDRYFLALAALNLYDDKTKPFGSILIGLYEEQDSCVDQQGMLSLEVVYRTSASDVYLVTCPVHISEFDEGTHVYLVDIAMTCNKSGIGLIPKISIKEPVDPEIS